MVTSDHALLIDGILIHAGALVNGTAITLVSMPDLGTRYTVYHIETESQEIILAEGTPAETFMRTSLAKPSTISPNTRRFMATNPR